MFFREALIDTKIERAVANMQSVVELGRVVRDRNTLPIKVCTYLLFLYFILYWLNKQSQDKIINVFCFTHEYCQTNYGQFFLSVFIFLFAHIHFSKTKKLKHLAITRVHFKEIMLSMLKSPIGYNFHKLFLKQLIYTLSLPLQVSVYVITLNLHISTFT